MNKSKGEIVIGLTMSLFLVGLVGTRQSHNSQKQQETETEVAFAAQGDFEASPFGHTKIPVAILELYKDGKQPTFLEVAGALGVKLPADYDKDYSIGYFGNSAVRTATFATLGKDTTQIVAIFTPITPANMDALHDAVAKHKQANEVRLFPKNGSEPTTIVANSAAVEQAIAPSAVVAK